MSNDELRTLTEFEHVALIALHKLLIRADSQLSGHEARVFKTLALEIGEARFRAAVAAASERYPSEESTRALVDEIGRPTARRVIYRRLRLLAESNRIAEPEAEMLRWIAGRWALTIDPTTLIVAEEA